jgi:hypothetical protein
LAVRAVSSSSILLNVKAASLAVTGLPSDHFTSSRKVKVHVSLSSEVFQDSARLGSTE